MKTFFKDIKFFKRLCLLALPIIIQDTLNSMVNLLDTFMIGLKLGVHEITAVGLSNQIFFLFILLVFGINSGSSIFMGQFWGKKDVISIRKTMMLCVAGSLLSASLFSSLAFFFPEKLMTIYSADPTVVALGVDYLRIIWVSYFLCAITASVNAALKSTGQTMLPMATTVVSLISNATLNYLFIFILNMGVKGAAIATVIARSIELVAQLILITKLKMPIIGKWKDYFQIEKTFIVRFLKTGLPVVANEFVWALGTSIYNIAYRFCGTEAQGAVQISSTIQNLFMVVGMGVGAACGIILSNELGAGEIEKSITYSRRFMVLSLCLSSFMGILLIISSPLIVNMFQVSEVVKGYSYRIIFVIAVGMIFKTFNYTTIVGILRSGGDTVYCLLLDMASVWLVGIPLAFLGATLFQLPVYWVVALVYGEEIFKFFFSGSRTLRNRWARKLV